MVVVILSILGDSFWSEILLLGIWMKSFGVNTFVRSKLAQLWHICSVEIGAIILTRHICSPNRHVHSAEMCYSRTDTSIQLERVQNWMGEIHNRHIYSGKTGCPRTGTSIRLEQAQSLRIDIFFCRTDTFVYHFHCKTNEFSQFLISFSSCFRITSDLNTLFIQKWNWTCEYTTFINNERRTYSNHLSCILNNRSRLKLSSNFPKSSLD